MLCTEKRCIQLSVLETQVHVPTSAGPLWESQDRWHHAEGALSDEITWWEKPGWELVLSRTNSGTTLILSKDNTPENKGTCQIPFTNSALLSITLGVNLLTQKSSSHTQTIGPLPSTQTLVCLGPQRRAGPPVPAPRPLLTSRFPCR